MHLPFLSCFRADLLEDADVIQVRKAVRELGDVLYKKPPG